MIIIHPVCESFMFLFSAKEKYSLFRPVFVFTPFVSSIAFQLLFAFIFLSLSPFLFWLLGRNNAWPPFWQAAFHRPLTTGPRSLTNSLRRWRRCRWWRWWRRMERWCWRWRCGSSGGEDGGRPNGPPWLRTACCCVILSFTFLRAQWASKQTNERSVSGAKWAVRSKQMIGWYE